MRIKHLKKKKIIFVRIFAPRKFTIWWGSAKAKETIKIKCEDTTLLTRSEWNIKNHNKFQSYM